MSQSEKAQPTQDEEASVLLLALRVLRGEITEAQAIELVKSQGKEG